MVDMATDRGASSEATARLRGVIENIRSATDPLSAMSSLDVALVREADGRRDVRRLLVSPFVKEGAFVPAIAALEVLVAAYPSQAEDRRMLASLFGRTKQWDNAIAQVDAAAEIEPGAVALHAARIQLRIQAGKVADAADVARTTAGLLVNEPGEAHLWMLALIRNGNTDEAVRMAQALGADKLPNERVAAMAVRALFEDCRANEAIRLGNAALSAGHDSAALRAYLGQACLQCGTEESHKAHARDHFEAGVRLAPSDVKLLSLYGETLVRAGRYKEALEPLSQALELAPDAEHTRGVYVRALRYSTQYAEAAEQMLKLLEKSPEKLLWQKSAVAALSQAGRKEEATELFYKYVSQRGKQLPDTFEEALNRLDERLDSAPIPQARFDWAWSMRGNTDIDRAKWERAVRWGHQVDHLLFDWLECREDRVEEAMQVLGDLSEGERFFEPLLASGKGVVLATAHVGPMYAGLMALELAGIPSRWLASAPNIAKTSYSEALISTADQTEAQVAKACIRAIGSGYVLCLAIDGASDPAAPRTIFEGQEVTYSSVASRMAHRLRVPSLFYAPRWENGRVAFTLEMLPAAEPDENVEAYVQRWQQAYFQRLREHLAGPPENLRMSGGIWRHVKPADKSAPLT
jgi:tetratricopeptide (TPR) repeat protein